MNAKQVYERVCLVTTIGERQFFDRLNDCLASLAQLYGEVPKLLWQAEEDGTYPESQWITNLKDEIKLLPLFHAALPDYVLYASGAGDAYGQSYAAKANSAWLTYWNRDAKGRRIRKRGPWCRGCKGCEGGKDCPHSCCKAGDGHV